MIDSISKLQLSSELRGYPNLVAYTAQPEIGRKVGMRDDAEYSKIKGGSPKLCS